MHWNMEAQETKASKFRDVSRRETSLQRLPAPAWCKMHAQLEKLTDLFPWFKRAADNLWDTEMEAANLSQERRQRCTAVPCDAPIQLELVLTLFEAYMSPQSISEHSINVKYIYFLNYSEYITI